MYTVYFGGTQEPSATIQGESFLTKNTPSSLGAFIHSSTSKLANKIRNLSLLTLSLFLGIQEISNLKIFQSYCLYPGL